MFIATKILEMLLFPPGLFIVLGVVGAVLALFRMRKSAVFLYVLMLGGLYLFSIGPVAAGLLVPLEDEYPAVQLSPVPTGADAVVILGGGSIAGAPDARSISGALPGTATQPATATSSAANGPTVLASLSAESTRRVVYGYLVARATKLPVIISGGAPLKIPGTESEAAAARGLLVALGMADNQIRTETESLTTWDNAVQVAKLFHPRKIILVTSAYHMPRAVYSFRKQKIEVVPAPTAYRIDRQSPGSLKYFPNISALRDSALALHERIGMFFYRLRHGRVATSGSSAQ